MGKKEQRQSELVRIVQAQGLLPVRALASLLGVSEMTVRRDLDALQTQAAGPQSAGAGQGEYSLLRALEKANAQKDRVGRFAASLVGPDDFIIIDTGSTTARMLPHLPGDKNLTVLCYNANVLAELRYRPGVQLLFCGGYYHPNTEMFESPEGIRFIRRFRAGKVFLSAAGVHRDMGVTCANAYEVPTKHAVIASSMERILLADSSKFGQVRPAHFCELADIHTIVTDKDLSPNWRRLLEDRGIRLHLV